MNKKIILSIAFVCSCLGIKAQSAWFGGVYTNSNSGISSAVMGLGSTLINMGLNSLTDSDSPLCSYDPYSFHYMKLTDNGEKIDFKQSNPYGFKAYDLFNNIEAGVKVGWQGRESFVGFYGYAGYGQNQYKLRFLGERDYSKHKFQNLRTGVGMRLSPLRFLMDDYDWCPIIEVGTTYVYNFSYKGPNGSDKKQINNGMRTSYSVGAQFADGCTLVVGFDMAHYNMFNKNYSPDGGYWFPYANFKNKDMNFYIRLNVRITDDD